MVFFTDSNVPLGYTVIHDKWHRKADKFVNSNQNSIFWSTLVKKEYETKFGDISNDVDYFLDSVESLLEDNENDFEYYSKFEDFVIRRTKNIGLDDFKKHQIIEHFWRDNNFDYAISEDVYIEFRKFNFNFNMLYFGRDKKLNSIMKLHNCGLDNYLNYMHYASVLKSWGVHSPDFKIILDAHDFGLIYNDLIFVSADNKMLEALDGHNLSFLKIKEFKALN